VAAIVDVVEPVAENRDPCGERQRGSNQHRLDGAEQDVAGDVERRQHEHGDHGRRVGEPLELEPRGPRRAAPAEDQGDDAGDHRAEDQQTAEGDHRLQQDFEGGDRVGIVDPEPVLRQHLVRVEGDADGREPDAEQGEPVGDGPARGKRAAIGEAQQEEHDHPVGRHPADAADRRGELPTGKHRGRPVGVDGVARRELGDARQHAAGAEDHAHAVAGTARDDQRADRREGERDQRVVEVAAVGHEVACVVAVDEPQHDAGRHARPRQRGGRPGESHAATRAHSAPSGARSHSVT
jgi:hypothetical protein